MNSADGFKDGNTNPNLNDYEYDNNDFRVKKIENLFCEESERSSMIVDRNKGITEITYNHLNLPTKITWPDNKSISYEYNAIGQKVSKSVRENNDSIKVVDYLDGFQYAGKVLQFFPTAEGYVRVNADKLQSLRTYNYVYNHTDHFDERNQSTALVEVCERSSVRLSYSKDPRTGELEILEETEVRGSRMPKKRRSHKTNNNEQNHSTSCASFDLEILNFQNLTCPFGLKHGVYTAAALKDFRIDEIGTDAVPGGGMGEVALINVIKTEYQYKYNGKEWQDELGLNMYAMDMRQYDPAIARWVVQDPVTHFDFSPYNAFDNNPVFWADPSGADAVNIGYDRVVDSNSFSGSSTWSGGFQEISGERKNDEFSANQNSSSQSNTNSEQNLDNGDPPGGKGESLASKFWNSRFVRLITGDKLSLSWGASGGSIFGASMSGNLDLILRGDDAGIYFDVFNTGSLDVTIGSGGDAFMTFGKSYFIGDVSQMTLESTVGSSVYIGGDLATPKGGIRETMSISFDPNNLSGNKWITKEAGPAWGVKGSVQFGTEWSNTRIGVGFDGKFRTANALEK